VAPRAASCSPCISVPLPSADAFHPLVAAGEIRDATWAILETDDQATAAVPLDLASTVHADHIPDARIELSHGRGGAGVWSAPRTRLVAITIRRRLWPIIAARSESDHARSATAPMV
jgi:hypothetical protein